jgi:hypothetical protein
MENFGSVDSLKKSIEAKRKYDEKFFIKTEHYSYIQDMMATDYCFKENVNQIVYCS